MRDLFYQDLQELVLLRFTDKQCERYAAMKGRYSDCIRRITKAAWAEAAIAEIEQRAADRRDAEFRAYEEFATVVKDRTFQATVKSFDKLSGDGWVYIPELNWTRQIFACNIKGAKTWYPETACVSYARGQVVEVQLVVHGFGSPVFVKGVTPGEFDAGKWAGLNTDKLAFTCDENGNLTSGLFA